MFSVLSLELVGTGWMMRGVDIFREADSACL